MPVYALFKDASQDGIQDPNPLEAKELPAHLTLMMITDEGHGHVVNHEDTDVVPDQDHAQEGTQGHVTMNEGDQGHVEEHGQDLERTQGGDGPKDVEQGSISC